MQDFSVTRPHRNVMNWTTDILSISTPDKDGDFYVEVTNQYDDTAATWLKREDLVLLRDWINEQLATVPAGK